jgi:hypothetical protein
MLIMEQAENMSESKTGARADQVLGKELMSLVALSDCVLGLR